MPSAAFLDGTKKNRRADTISAPSEQYLPKNIKSKLWSTNDLPPPEHNL